MAPTMRRAHSIARMQMIIPAKNAIARCFFNVTGESPLLCENERNTVSQDEHGEPFLSVIPHWEMSP